MTVSDELPSSQLLRKRWIRILAFLLGSSDSWWSSRFISLSVGDGRASVGVCLREFRRRAIVDHADAPQGSFFKISGWKMVDREKASRLLLDLERS